MVGGEGIRHHPATGKSFIVRLVLITHINYHRVMKLLDIPLSFLKVVTIFCLFLICISLTIISMPLLWLLSMGYNLIATLSSSMGTSLITPKFPSSSGICVNGQSRRSSI